MSNGNFGKCHQAGGRKGRQVAAAAVVVVAVAVAVAAAAATAVAVAVAAATTAVASHLSHISFNQRPNSNKLKRKLTFSRARMPHEIAIRVSWKLFREVRCV